MTDDNLAFTWSFIVQLSLWFQGCTFYIRMDVYIGHVICGIYKQETYERIQYCKFTCMLISVTNKQ